MIIMVAALLITIDNKNFKYNKEYKQFNNNYNNK